MPSKVLVETFHSAASVFFDSTSDDVMDLFDELSSCSVVGGWRMVEGKVAAAAISWSSDVELVSASGANVDPGSVIGVLAGAWMMSCCGLNSGIALVG